MWFCARVRRMSARDPDLGEALMHATRALRRRWWHALEEWEISPHQVRALHTVCGHDEARLSEIATRLRIAPRSATEVVDSLEARGLVERRPDPADRRAVLVVPTAEGQRMHDATQRARAAAGEEFFAGLDAAEQRQLTGLLRRLVE